MCDKSAIEVRGVDSAHDIYKKIDIIYKSIMCATIDRLRDNVRCAHDPSNRYVEYLYIYICRERGGGEIEI